MILITIFIPLFGTFISGFFGLALGSLGSVIFTVYGMFITFFLSCFIFYETSMQQTVVLVQNFPWIITEYFTLYWGFLFDSLTIILLLVVTFISSLVHLYSTEYMKQDPHLIRFLSYLSFFTFFMLMLITGDNFLQLFVGWEGVGLCSFLLINFWYGRIQANKSALKAMIVNRVGDFGLGLAIFALYFFFDSLNYCISFAQIPSVSKMVIPFFSFDINILDFIGFFLFVGAVGKSAQLGLHTWLPDAMEGPTPVSALIHAATMVTAGVFLLSRSSILLEYALYVKIIIAFLGGMTTLLAATTGLFQNDMKRVVAYSTCSQLGYMVFAVGLSCYAAGVFHLSNHAVFKALLFLGAGVVIHAMNDEQDMRKMGGLVKILPFTYSTILIGSLALMGFPFLTGFYSKDLILEMSFGSFLLEGRFVFIIGSLVAFLTAFYSIKSLILTFLRPANGFKSNYENAHEGSFKLLFPLFLLAFGSIFVGFLSKDMMVGFGSSFWGNALFVKPNNFYGFEGEWLSPFIKTIPLICSFAGVFFSYFFYVYQISFLYNLKLSKFGRLVYSFFNRKWFFDKLYNSLITQYLLFFSYFGTYKNIDRGLLEYLGPHGFSEGFKQLVYFFKITNKGFTFNLLFWILIFFFLMICLLAYITFFLNNFLLIYFFLIIILVFNLII